MNGEKGKVKEGKESKRVSGERGKEGLGRELSSLGAGTFGVTSFSLPYA